MEHLGTHQQVIPLIEQSIFWPATNHATLAFFFGANLPDPHHILVGEGKGMRHVKVKFKNDFKELLDGNSYQT
jgi:hypothetical protein